MSLVLTVLGLVFLLLPAIDTDSHQVKQKEGTNWNNIVGLGDQKEELNNHVWGRAGTRGPGRSISSVSVLGNSSER